MSRDSAVAQAQAQRIGDKKNRGSLSSSGSAITVDPVSEENPAKPLLSPKTTAVNDDPTTLAPASVPTKRSATTPSPSRLSLAAKTCYGVFATIANGLVFVGKKIANPVSNHPKKSLVAAMLIAETMFELAYTGKLGSAMETGSKSTANNLGNPHVASTLAFGALGFGAKTAYDGIKECYQRKLPM